MHHSIQATSDIGLSAERTIMQSFLSPLGHTTANKLVCDESPSKTQIVMGNIATGTSQVTAKVMVGYWQNYWK